ncbi:ABC transporter ATP-binding protein [Tropicibacter naphthalenivorans]|uniref:Putative ABC transporter ATP-binding protein YbhF n=1 Tax=Tropicibacter naphthalenivorans TaxID=441103 RepID=A0A0P1GPY8_9RHOB|nr:ABC transporter ATP-binding protein [Tropicibacter naphthalenivorans]CUH77332.1 putative ABC transporter ATP-binding protein YbhF [Tropicibacter naphthalenivorans]SMC58959.1 ABC-2 type transport system ATP-binding protein [Tropicibacter naphthalenivorans]
MSLKVSDLSFSYGPKRALDAVTFEARSGKFTALLGPNGAGKSTLFGLLTRLFTSPQGVIEVAGQDLRSAPRAALAQMGIVFQQQTLDLDLTVRQNLTYFAALHGLSGRDARTRIDAALDRLSMLERAHEKARALNGGHRRRAEIARALIHQPKVLLLDEPTVGLDAAARAAITTHVHDLTQDHALTVLWATHLTDEVLPDDDVVLLHQGRIRATGPAQDLCGTQTLKDWFLSQTQAPA